MNKSQNQFQQKSRPTKDHTRIANGSHALQLRRGRRASQAKNSAGLDGIFKKQQAPTQDKRNSKRVKHKYMARNDAAWLAFFSMIPQLFQTPNVIFKTCGRGTSSFC
jgi:hypothetical protein